MLITKRLSHRFDVLFLIVIFIFVALISRLAYLQLYQGDYYSLLADGNRIRLIPSMAPRGIFYDRNGVAVVSNRPGFTVSLLPLVGPVEDSVLQQLSAILVMPVDEIKQKLEQHVGSFEPVRIKTNVGADIVTRIE